MELGLLLEDYEAGLITHREAAFRATELVEIPSVARILARLPTAIAGCLDGGAGHHLARWIWIGGEPTAAAALRSRVPARVLAEWGEGHWRSWPHPIAPGRTCSRETLRENLADPEPEVRCAATAALAWSGVWDEALLAGLDDGDARVRSWTAWAIAVCDGPVAPLLNRLAAEPPVQRPEIAWAIHALQGPSELVAEALVATLATPARARAATVLGSIGPAALPAREALIAGLRDPDFAVAAMSALAALGPASANAIPEIDRLGIPERWGAASGDPAKLTRTGAEAAAALCGLFAAARELPRLIWALERPGLRRAALWAIAELPVDVRERPGALADVCTAILRGELDYGEMRALGALGAAAAPAVPALIRHVEAGGRLGAEAAGVLGSLGALAAEAAPALAQAAWSLAADRRGRAYPYEEALARLGAAAESECLAAAARPELREAALRVLARMLPVSERSTERA